MSNPPIEVEVGQWWTSKRTGEHRKIVSVNREPGYAILQGKVRSTIRVSTLRQKYKLSQQALEPRT